VSFIDVRSQLYGSSRSSILQYVSAVSAKADSHGFGELSAEERYVFVAGTCHLDDSALDEVLVFDAALKAELRALPRQSVRSYSRVASLLFHRLLDPNMLPRVSREPMEDGPAIVFVANMGSQVPTARPAHGYQPTLGYQLRRRRGLVPPFGLYYVASYLSLLGAETHVFNLALGDHELEEFKEVVNGLGNRLWFVSFASNFFDEGELESLFHIDELLRQQYNGQGRPRLVGGGMGVYFKRDDYLRHTAMEVVIGRYGEPSFGDMVFSSDYRGPEDTSDNIELFGDLPNLHFLAPREQGLGLHSTPVQLLSKTERQILANAFDLGRVPYEEKYWSTGLAIAICSPDDLNIPSDLVLPEMSEKGKSKAVDHGADNARRKRELDSFISIRSEDDPVHPANYLYKPKGVKVMTTFGNCPRGCKFCQFTKFDEHIFFISANEVIDKFNQAVEQHPDLQMILIDDDDFLLKRSHIVSLVEGLRTNLPTRGKVFYVETTPMDVEPDILKSLHEVGFRAVLLGIESPVERIARHVGKLRPQHSFNDFVQAPRLAHDAGLFTRVTTIPFYPIVEEPELIATIERLTEFINYGISVSVFPIVKALPGTEFAQGKMHEIMTSTVLVPGGNGGTIEIPQYVLPDDPVVRRIAFKSLQGTPFEVNSILTKYGIVGDYPMSLGVLAFFRSVLRAWTDVPDRSVESTALEELSDEVEVAIAGVTRKHFIQRDVQNASHALGKGDRAGYEKVESWLRDNSSAHALTALRLLLDFGDDHEVEAVARLTERLVDAGGDATTLHRSLLYCLERSPKLETTAAIEAALRRINQGTQGALLA
jgi:radical SAM superfamily enzyme YgiQ (UPF0313 family)